jgi:hypothetical protein
MTVDTSMPTQPKAFSHFLPSIDLSAVRLRVAKKNIELTAEQLDNIESRYLQFLQLCKNDPKIKHEPEKDVDEYWHTHILDTRKYAEDCQRYFGYFLHHIPNNSGEDKCENDGCGAISV